MSILKQKLPNWLLIIVALYILLLFGASFIKYYFHLYNAYDLAIYNQVFWNSANGDWFEASINPPSYLGDHFEILLALFVPLYKIFPTPLTLLFLQTLFLALAAIPLYLIANKYLSPIWTKLVVAAWLLNPFVHSINLFEYHSIAILPLFLFLLWYFFITNRGVYFFITLLLILLVREDAGITSASFGLLMLFSKRFNYKYITFGITTIILSAIWVIVAVKLVSLFNIGETYKFFELYGWLGNSFIGIVQGIVKNPVAVLRHIIRIDTVSMWLLLLFPLSLIPLLAPRYLIALILPLFQLYLIK